MVSLAILAGMMAMVAMVFSSASKSSGQAQSSAMIHRHLQQIADTIRRDLDGMQGMTTVPPILAIGGVEINALEKPGNPSLGSHRADVLMLVTQRPFEPYVYTDRSIEFSPVHQVVYGHANFGKLSPTGGWIAGSVRPVQGTLVSSVWVSQIPASQWHLARRVVGFPLDPGKLLYDVGKPLNHAGWPLTGDPFSGAEGNAARFADVFTGTLASITSVLSRGFFTYDAAGQLTSAYLQDGSYGYRLDPNDTLYLLDAASPPVYWWQWRKPGPWWWRTDPSGDVSHAVGVFGPPDFSIYDSSNSARHWPEWCYTGSDSRVRLDPAPPAGVPERMAAYFLPGCSEFKVEFTYDDPREIAINREGDPSSNPNYGEPILTKGQDTNGDGLINVFDQIPAPTPVRWQSVPKGGLYVWYDLPVDDTMYKGLNAADLRDMTHPYRWPRALRITLRAYDPRGSLDQPSTQTIIHIFD